MPTSRRFVECVWEFRLATFNYNLWSPLQAYVSCALGISQIGYVMICFGVVNAICSIIFGTVMKYTGRIPIILLGMVVHGAIIIVLMFWRPNPDQPLIFFTISGLYGVGDAVWQTQINGKWGKAIGLKAAVGLLLIEISLTHCLGIYGALFRRNKEAAFSNYRLWESAGFVIAYAYSTTLCALMKLYVLFSVLVLGILGWIIVEVRHRRKVR